MKIDEMLAIAAGGFVLWKLLHLPKDAPPQRAIPDMSQDRRQAWWDDGEDIEPME